MLTQSRRVSTDIKKCDFYSEGRGFDSQRAHQRNQRSIDLIPERRRARAGQRVATDRRPQQEACGFQTLRQDPLFIRTLPPSAKDASGDAPPNP